MSYIVLDEILMKNFFNFYRRENTDPDVIRKLFCKFHPFLVTLEQMTVCGIPPFAQQAMAAIDAPWTVYSPKDKTASAFSCDLLEEMVHESKLKLLLTKDATNFPCKTLSLDGQCGEQLSYTSTYKAQEQRDSAILHIKHFLKSAENTISIHDQYINNVNVASFSNLFEDVDKNVQINIYTGRIGSKDQQNFRLSLCNTARFMQDEAILKLKVRPYSGSILHDRYIQIDSRVEIILSSGFSYLFTTTKDFTYIVRTLI